MGLVSRIYRGEGAKQLKRVDWVPTEDEFPPSSSAKPQLARRGDRRPVPPSPPEPVPLRKRLRWRLWIQVVDNLLGSRSTNFSLRCHQREFVHIQAREKLIAVACESNPESTKEAAALQAALRKFGFRRWHVRINATRSDDQECLQVVDERQTNDNEGVDGAWESVRYRWLSKSLSWFAATGPAHVRIDQRNRVIWLPQFAPPAVCSMECKKMTASLREIGFKDWKVSISPS